MKKIILLLLIGLLASFSISCSRSSNPNEIQVESMTDTKGINFFGKIRSKIIKTKRLNTHVLLKGKPWKEAVILIHGNVSSSVFFRPLMEKFSKKYFVIALDLRGFGCSETKTIDATKGVRDFSRDVKSLVKKLKLKWGRRKIHLVGWSVGGGVAMQYTMDYPNDVASITLIAPMSPHGFGGTKNSGLSLIANYPDFSGSGGGTANPSFVDCLKNRDLIGTEGNTCTESNTAKTVMNSFYFKTIDGMSLKERGIITAKQETEFLNGMYSTVTSENSYPGGYILTGNWPNVAPAETGMNNAISPKYFDVTNFKDVKNRKGKKPNVLWIRGTDDFIVSDTSFFDFGFLGSLGYVPGWPGNDIFPPQAMVSQMASVLEAYTSNGGAYERIDYPDTGHSPHVEKVDRFYNDLYNFIENN